MSVRSTVSPVSEQISTLEETEAKRGFVASIRRYFADRFSDDELVTLAQLLGRLESDPSDS